MKKILGLLTLVTLVSCGGSGTSTEVKSDSTTVVVDSLKQDSTVVPVDTTKVEESK
jgi:hypothetical protein